nr:hypothetical protein [Actinomycetota bacterium]
MSSTSRRQGAGWDAQTTLLAIGLVALAVTVAPVTLAIHVGNRLDGGRQSIPANPAEMIVGLVRGELTWPGP